MMPKIIAPNSIIIPNPNSTPPASTPVWIRSNIPSDIETTILTMAPWIALLL